MKITKILSTWQQKTPHLKEGYGDVEHRQGYLNL